MVNRDIDIKDNRKKQKIAERKRQEIFCEQMVQTGEYDSKGACIKLMRAPFVMLFVIPSLSVFLSVRCLF